MSEENAKDQEATGDDGSDALVEQSASEKSAEENADWGDAMQEQAASEASAEDTIQAAEFQNLQQGSASGSDTKTEDLNLDVILDVPVTISMEIGRTYINIRNLLQLNQGSVVELDRLAGEPMDVLVNGTLIAHGEVVVVNDKFGIRLTDVISPSERVKKLG
jgi:flagellar motor switch protein FliN/FliY